jgi:hypothetical protein
VAVAVLVNVHVSGSAVVGADGDEVMVGLAGGPPAYAGTSVVPTRVSTLMPSSTSRDQVGRGPPGLLPLPTLAIVPASTEIGTGLTATWSKVALVNLT